MTTPSVSYWQQRSSWSQTHVNVLRSLLLVLVALA